GARRQATSPTLCRLSFGPAAGTAWAHRTGFDEGFAVSRRALPAGTFL
ncbi:MAG: hypothetical protein AVDCRST_MAG78-385, partial [uncultured Rubrobacteraceae bacterium]